MEQVLKSMRMQKRTATTHKLLAVQSDLTAGQTLDALHRFQGWSKYLRDPRDKALFERVWGQCVLAAQRAGKTGWKDTTDPHSIEIEIQ